MKKFEEVLAAADDQKLQFEMRGQRIVVPLSVVEKAKLVFEYKTNSKKK